MTDKELLELAAKAAGIECYWVESGPDSPTMVLNEPYYATWNPLTDDGDALRLAVKLNSVVWECNQYDRAMAEVRYGEARGEYWEFVGEDSYAATRRAIVRAAAEIGKAMP
jgi:hypothetical protein